MAGFCHPFPLFGISSYSKEKEFGSDQLTPSIVSTFLPLPGFCVYAALTGEQKADTLVEMRYAP